MHFGRRNTGQRRSASEWIAQQLGDTGQDGGDRGDGAESDTPGAAAAAAAARALDAAMNAHRAQRRFAGRKRAAYAQPCTVGPTDEWRAMPGGLLVLWDAGGRGVWLRAERAPKPGAVLSVEYDAATAIVLGGGVVVPRDFELADADERASTL